jgi:hypothetical protein
MGIPGKEFRGVVVSGRGFGAQRMANPAVLHTAQRLTALTLVPRTLNVRLPQPFDGLLPWYLTEADLGGNVWRDHAPNRTGIRCGEVLIARRYHGMVFQGDEPKYPPATLRSEFRQPSRRWCHSYTALRNRGWIFPSCAPGLNAEKCARSDVDERRAV